jgi:hypothetical protein
VSEDSPHLADMPQKQNHMPKVLPKDNLASLNLLSRQTARNREPQITLHAYNILPPKAMQHTEASSNKRPFSHAKKELGLTRKASRANVRPHKSSVFPTTHQVSVHIQ